MSTEKQPEWEKEFDKQFTVEGQEADFMDGGKIGMVKTRFPDRNVRADDIKSFIRTFASSLLDEVKLEKRELTPEALEDFEGDMLRAAILSYNTAVSDLTTKVEGIKTRHGL